MATKSLCSFPDCGNASHSRGWCKKHYRRWERHGDPAGKYAFHGEQEEWIKAKAAYDGDECLIWPFFINPNGYGRARKSGKAIGAHTYMCELIRGPSPGDEYETAHSCRQRACINPAHVRWATKPENMQDKTADGTQLLGEKNHQTKLTTKRVLAIRKLEGSCTLSEAAERFDVHLSTVHRIWRRKAWSWL
jgi:hypothetical protein